MVWRWIRDLDRVRRDLNHLVRESHPSRWVVHAEEADPPLNVYESPEEVLVTAEVPGADREKFDVSLTSGLLQIRGSYRSEAPQGTLLRSERPKGAFVRVVRLGEHLDPHNVHAAYGDGILTVRVAKSREALPRKIEVKVN